MAVLLTSEAYTALQYFSTFSHEDTTFGKKGTEYKIFSTTLSEMFLILRKIKGEITINVNKSSCILVTRVRKISKCDNLLRHVRPSLRPHGTTRLPLDAY